MRKSNIDNLIFYFKEEVKKEIGKENEPEASDMVYSLDGIGMRALYYREYKLFAQAEARLAGLLFDIENTAGGLEEDTVAKRTHLLIQSILSSTCKEVIDNPRAPIIVLRQIKNSAVKAIKENLSVTWLAARNILVIIENLCKTDDRIIISSFCDNTLHEIALNAPRAVISPPVEIKPGESKDLTDLLTSSPFHNLLQTELEIHRKHLKRDWMNNIPVFIEHTFELIEIQIANPWLEGPSLKLPHHHLLIDHLFELTKYATDKSWNMIIVDLLKRISEIISNLNTEVNPMFSKSLVDNLDEFGEYCLKVKENDKTQWYIFRGRIYEKIAAIADTAISQGNYDLCLKAQAVYSKTIIKGNVYQEILTSLISSLVSQTKSLLTTQQLIYNNHLAFTTITTISSYLSSGIKKEHAVIDTFWQDVKPVVDGFIKLCLEGEIWKETIVGIHGLMKEYIWNTHPYNPSDDVLQYFWIALAIRATLNEQQPCKEIDTHGIGAFLKEDTTGIDSRLWTQWKKTGKLVTKDFGQEVYANLQIVRDCINDERRRLKMDRWT